MTLEKTINILKEHSAVLLYFSGENCGVCKVLQPKIQKAFDENYPDIKQYYLDIEKYKDIAVYFNIFSIPTILVFLDGNEFVRKGRNISVAEVIGNLKRPYSLLIGDK